MTALFAVRECRSGAGAAAWRTVLGPLSCQCQSAVSTAMVRVRNAPWRPASGPLRRSTVPQHGAARWARRRVLAGTLGESPVQGGAEGTQNYLNGTPKEPSGPYSQLRQTAAAVATNCPYIGPVELCTTRLSKGQI